MAINFLKLNLFKTKKKPDKLKTCRVPFKYDHQLFSDR